MFYHFLFDFSDVAQRSDLFGAWNALLGLLQDYCRCATIRYTHFVCLVG